MTRICSVEGCGKPHDAHGFCRRHDARFVRHGSPFGGGIDRGERHRFLTEKVIHYAGDECLIWPYAKDGNGYAVTTYKGKQTSACRVVCEIINGPMILPREDVAHSCGNGPGGCITPKHLRWATTAENMADKVAHGTDNRGEKNPLAKLTDDQVRSIRKMRGVKSESKIATEFGVSRSAIANIMQGNNWKYVQ